METPFTLAISGLANHVAVMSFDGRERINRCFRFDLIVRVPAGAAAALESTAIDRGATLHLGSGPSGRRIGGVIEALEWRGAHGSEVAFALRLVPRLALLKRRRTSRIFQEVTVVGLVDVLLELHGVTRRWTSQTDYRKRPYCVQYRESDYAFITRLLREHGLMFHFEDVAGGKDTTLVIGDAIANYQPIAGDRTLIAREADGTALAHEEDHVHRATLRRRARPTAALIREHDYAQPNVVHAAAAEAAHEESFTERARELDPSAALTDRLALHYEHHGSYEHAEVSRAAGQVLLEQLRSGAACLAAESHCQRLAPGHLFTLAEHELGALNRSWVVATIEHRGRAPALAQEGPVYHNVFRAEPDDVPLRPAPARRRARQVAETATVVGPAADEIHCDELGRIKVQFHWDLRERNDERASCWLRVAQVWGGDGFGMHFIPRIGMEVLVTFIAGDPDRPVVTGCLHDPVRPPAFHLPHAATTSGIRTRSSPGGNGEHELSFDDAAGAEQIRLRSQRDMEIAAERDLETNVGASRTTHVRGDDRIDVSGDRTVTVHGAASETGRGSREVVIHGSDRHSVLEDRTTHVLGLENATWAGGATFTSDRSYVLSVRDNYSLAIGSGDSTAQINVSGKINLGGSKTVSLGSDERIVLRVGSSSLEIGPDAITLKSPTVRLEGSEVVIAESNGPRLTLAKDAELVAKEIRVWSEKAKLELNHQATLRGDKVQLASTSVPPKPRSNGGDDKTKPFAVELTDFDFEPYREKHYLLVAGETRREGKTSFGGQVSAEIPEDATMVDLTCWLDEYPTGRRRTWQIQLERLPPAKVPQGAMQRLANLGYFEGAPAAELTEAARAALRWFQQDHEIDETGALDAATAAELEKVHGG